MLVVHFGPSILEMKSDFNKESRKLTVINFLLSFFELLRDSRAGFVLFLSTANI